MPIVKVKKYVPKPLQVNLLGEPECRDREAEELILMAARATYAAFDYPLISCVVFTLRRRKVSMAAALRPTILLHPSPSLLRYLVTDTYHPILQQGSS